MGMYYEGHLKILLKIDVRMKTDAKSDQLKNERKSSLFSAPSNV